MLYKFKSRATADLILLEPHGRRLLQIMGKEPSPHGIVTVEQISAAITALEAAVALEEAHHVQAQAARQAEGVDAIEATEAQPETVRLHQRAAPLIEMLRRSLADKHDVVW